MLLQTFSAGTPEYKAKQTYFSMRLMKKVFGLVYGEVITRKTWDLSLIIQHIHCLVQFYTRFSAD